MKRIIQPRRLLAVFGFLLLAIAPAMATEKMTDFDPNVHGFAFANTFQNDFVRETDWRTSGLCGGMVYTALDFYRTNKPIPRQTYRPAVQTRLHDYIYDRQVNSNLDNADKWAELGFNPFGARNSEFFNWGLQGFGGGRLQELRAKIDRGLPVPLGLWHYGNQPGGDHQVLAIGYDTGRYRGDLGRHKEDLKIFIYDPNHPNQTMTLVPDLRLGGYRYTNSDEVWLTYFVDGKYRPQQPRGISSGREAVAVTKPSEEDDNGKARAQSKAIARVLASRRVVANMPIVLKTPVKAKPAKLTTRELRVTIWTGNDDLRGGNDNVDLIVGFRGRSPMRLENVNRGRRWLGNYDQTIPIRLRGDVPLDDLVDLSLSTRFGGGLFGDNWNVDGLTVVAVTAEGEKTLYEKRGAPLVRFTGEKHVHRAPLSP